MRAMVRRTRRQVFYGFLCWMPILFVGFSVLYVDAWLNTQTRSNDYALAELSGEIRALQESINEVRAKEAQLEAVKLLTMRASEIGLVEPQPQQIQIVQYFRGQRHIIGDDIPLALARLEQSKARMQCKAARMAAAEHAPAQTAENKTKTTIIESKTDQDVSISGAEWSLIDAMPLDKLQESSGEASVRVPMLEVPHEPLDDSSVSLDFSVNALLAEL